jgi:hypothetical protein
MVRMMMQWQGSLVVLFVVDSAAVAQARDVSRNPVVDGLHRGIDLISVELVKGDAEILGDAPDGGVA